jgi:hypothetical protein
VAFFNFNRGVPGGKDCGLAALFPDLSSENKNGLYEDYLAINLREMYKPTLLF